MNALKFSLSPDYLFIIWTSKSNKLTTSIVVTSQILTVPSKEAVANMSQLSGWNSQQNIVSVWPFKFGNKRQHSKQLTWIYEQTYTVTIFDIDRPRRTDCSIWRSFNHNMFFDILRSECLPTVYTVYNLGVYQWLVI